MILGTVGYMSPEQARGQDVDHRLDLFSFGAVFHEMLTGRQAFARATAVETLTAIMNDEPLDLADSGAKAPPALDRVIRRCLEKHPEDRFHSACDLAFALENALTANGNADVPPARRRRGRMWAAAALVACSLAAGAGVSSYLRPATEQYQRALPDPVWSGWRPGSLSGGRFCGVHVEPRRRCPNLDPRHRCCEPTGDREADSRSQGPSPALVPGRQVAAVSAG